MIYISKKENYLNLKKYLKGIYISPYDVLIIIDNILNYKSDEIIKINTLFDDLKINTLFVSLIDIKNKFNYQVINKFNVEVYKFSNYAFFLTKKEIFTINNLNFLYVNNVKDPDLKNSNINYFLLDDCIYKIKHKSLIKYKCINNIFLIKSLYLGNIKKKIKYHLYLDINSKNNKTNNLYIKFKYKTSLKEKDLPEYYVKGFYYHQKGYLSSKDIISFKYIINYYYKNNINNDILIIFYKNKEVYHVKGKEIIKMILACEKYMQKDLSYLKTKINFRLHFAELILNNNLSYTENILYSLYKKLIDNNINKIDAFEILLSSKISDKIFKKDKRYLEKSIDKLFMLLKKETKLEIKDIIDYEEV